MVVRVSGPDACTYGWYNERRDARSAQVRGTQVPVKMTSHCIYSPTIIYIKDVQTEDVSIPEVAFQSLSPTGSAHTRPSAASVDNNVARVYRFDKPHGMIVVSASEHIDVFVSLSKSWIVQAKKRKEHRC
jgi:hypothetical protein